MTNNQSGIELSWYSKGYEDGRREASKQWQGLSDDEIAVIINEHTFKAIENLLKEKNT